MGKLHASEAKLLQAIADATDRKLPCPPLTFTAAGKFAVNGWIRNVGDGADRFVITNDGRRALIDRNSRRKNSRGVSFGQWRPYMRLV